MDSKTPASGAAEPEDPLEARNAAADFALIASVILTVVVYQLPHADSWPLIFLSTLAHEMGHGITALLTGGRFISLLINEDASGVAMTQAARGLPQALVSAGGLVGPACAAAFLFVLARWDKLARASLVVLAVALAACIPTLLVGSFGKTFVGIVAAVFLLVGWRAPRWVARGTLVFVAVQLALSVYSRGDYLFTPVAHMQSGDMPSDVATISASLGLPYWFWGGVCGAFSVLVLLVGARLSLRGFGSGRRPRESSAPVSSTSRTPAKAAPAPERPVVPGSPAAEIEKMLQRLKNPERSS